MAFEEKKIRLLAYAFIFSSPVHFKVISTFNLVLLLYKIKEFVYIDSHISFNNNNNKINNNNNNRIIILILSGQIVTSFSSTAIGSEIQNI